jgi:tetratricopeptide (TPR) repeat protein
MPPRARRKAKAAESPAHPAPRAWPRAALIVLAVVLVYANSLSGPFIFDDQLTVVGNGAIRSLSGALTPPRDSPVAGRPVAALTFALNYAYDGLQVGVYHATNIAIHAINALLIFGLVRRTLRLPRLTQAFGARSDDLALAVAVIWAVHPINSEAVNYITQRTESLMALFLLLTLYSSVRAYDSPRSVFWEAAAVIACMCGMGSKETMAVAPLLVVLYDRVFLFPSVRDALKRRERLYVGLALAWLILAGLNISGPRSGSAGLSTFSPWTYLLNQSVMILRYLRLAIWPTDLVNDYGVPVSLTLGSVWLQCSLIAGSIVLAAAAFQWNPPLAFLGAWFFITLAPASSFLPIATEVGAERRMYVPMVALIALGVLAASQVNAIRERSSRLAAIVAVSLIAVTLGSLTIMRNREYVSSLRLAETSLARWPSEDAHGVLGGELVGEGRDAEALEHLRIGVRVSPRARYNLGVALFNLKRLDEARTELETLIRENPWREEMPWSRRVIGHTYALEKRYPEAITQLRMALALTPGDADATRLLVEVLDRQGVEQGMAGRPEEAVKSFQAAVEIDPRNASVRHNLATALLDTGNLEAGIAAARESLAMNASDALSQNLLGRALAMQGHYAEALPHLETAVKLRPQDPQLREDLDRVVTAAKGRTKNEERRTKNE